MNYIINNEYYTVSRLNASIKKILENSIGYIKLKGEVSGLSQPSSGHLYFNVKDEKETIAVVCWRSTASKLSFFPVNGKNILISGKITTYSRQSKIQLIVDDIELEGEGEILKILEARKQKLLKEGIFKQDVKKKIPSIPERLGVITSESGSVINDIIHRINERYPLEIILYPVVVQGEDSAEQIINALKNFNFWFENNDEEKIVSTIIIARGGGSLEDLMPFNDENLVRSIFNSKIPVISAIGHDTDWTLCDNVADLRAPTPTAAAEVSVPVKTELIFKLEEKFNYLTKLSLNRLENLNLKFDKKKSSLPDILGEVQNRFQEIDWIQEKFHEKFSRLIMEKKNNYNMISNSIISKDMLSNIHDKYQDIRRLEEKFEEKLFRLILERKNDLNKVSHNINQKNFRLKIRELKIRIKNSFDKISLNLRNKIEKEKTLIGQKHFLLQSLSYKSILKRGYAVVRQKEKIIKKSKDIIFDSKMSIELYDSKFYAKKIKN